jgi:hypothetical protein
VEGTPELLGTYPTKSAAQAAGREEARAWKVEHLIRNLDGRIGERKIYGHDPLQHPRLTRPPPS